MLTFDKKHEVIERVENYGGFLLVQQLQPNDNLENFTQEQIIADIIGSKFHIWIGARANYEERGTPYNHMFYGFYDNSKIKPEHYAIIPLEQFYEKLFKAVYEHTDNEKSFTEKASEIIKGSFPKTATIYHLDLDIKKNADLVAEWHVYDFFYAFIAIDRNENKVWLIEFGLD